MDFGDLPLKELNTKKFPLPKEPEENIKILGGKPVKKTEVYIGCAKWGRKEWLGKVYPKGTPEKKFLEAYVSKFNSVELNATHYKMYKPDQVEVWAEKAEGINFKFCPKVYKGISHFGNLLSKQPMTNDFLNAIETLGKNLGPVFLQLNDRFSPNRKSELFEYLGGLPRDINFFVELRHPDWYTEKTSEELFSTLRRLKMGAVITDSVGRRDCCHMRLTTKTAFVRFAGNDLHRSDYKRIDDWAKRIQYWKANGLKELYFFMHMHDETYTPELCDYLKQKL